MKMVTVRAAIAALTLGLVPSFAGLACEDTQVAALVQALGEGCLIDSDCQGELVCVFRHCHAQCETTKDCRDLGQETDCVRGETAKVCLLEDEEACDVEETDTGDGLLVPLFLHASCPSEDLLCARDGECRNRCDDDGDCVSGAVCTVTGVCAEAEDAADANNDINEEGEAGAETATCIFSSECVAPLVCSANVCREACLGDADCAAGQRCTLVEAPTLGTSFGACRSADDDPTLPAACKNGMLDAGESDVDCGGDTCHPCPSGSLCGAASDCASGSCSEAGICQVPSCDDGIQNANETDVDCGGAECPACEEGDGCLDNGDCVLPLRCDSVSSSCVVATCLDGLHNGGESDVDCGGACGACGDGDDCALSSDCLSGVCASGSCQPPSCGDGVKNGSEAAIDCGGPASGCATCGDGASCSVGAECASGSCPAGSCAAPSCSDGVMNGFELGLDCGGAACALLGQGCALGTACNADGDCDQTSPAGCHPSNGLCTARYTVSITVAGAGAGRVLSNPAGINCHTTSPSICAAELFDGESITLSGVPDATYGFDGFSDGCTGNPSCMITVSAADVAVTATFQ